MADQAASLFGSGCFKPGDLKITMGTGTFMDVNTGQEPHASVAGNFVKLYYISRRIYLILTNITKLKFKNYRTLSSCRMANRKRISICCRRIFKRHRYTNRVG